MPKKEISPKGKRKKLSEEVLTNIQKRLNAGEAVFAIAKKVRIAESSIRSAIKDGRLKK